MSGDLEIKTIFALITMKVRWILLLNSVIVKYDLKVFKLVNEVKN